MNENSLRERLMQISKLRGESFNETWHNFVLERFLVRMAKSKYQKSFVFKGGFLLGKYLNLGRETKDLDFLAREIASEKPTIEKALREISGITLEDGLTFSLELLANLPHPHMKIPGFQASLIAHLGRMREPVSIDIGIGDVAEPVDKEILLTRSKGSSLFEESISLLVYSPETIFAEKIQTAVVRKESNSRMKDYFDLLMLVKSDLLHPDKLRTALNATFKYRDTSLELLPLKFDDSQLRHLQIYWTNFRRNFKGRSNMPEENFTVIVQKINEFLIDNNLAGK